eukprot:Awhi_evm1s13964
MKVNFDKTILMHRRGDPSVIKALKEFVDYTKESVRYLGVFVGDEKNAQEKNDKKFRERIISTIGKVQRSRSLSIQQRLLVLNALLTSKSPFFSKTAFISENFLIEMKKSVLKAFKNRIFSKIDLIAPTNLGG